MQARRLAEMEALHAQLLAEKEACVAKRQELERRYSSDMLRLAEQELEESRQKLAREKAAALEEARVKAAGQLQKALTEIFFALKRDADAAKEAKAKAKDGKDKKK